MRDRQQEDDNIARFLREQGLAKVQRQRSHGSTSSLKATSHTSPPTFVHAGRPSSVNRTNRLDPSSGAGNVNGRLPLTSVTSTNVRKVASCVPSHRTVAASGRTQ